MEQRDFARAALEYVCLIQVLLYRYRTALLYRYRTALLYTPLQEVQERKKFEFVETVSPFPTYLQCYSTKYNYFWCPV